MLLLFTLQFAAWKPAHWTFFHSQTNIRKPEITNMATLAQMHICTWKAEVVYKRLTALA